ncbi:MAG: hypothetical protein HQ498_06945 [Pseudohongiella sp.]|jgi:hypothetical protein|nr:hypothetical protein [Pseudohongiella sp.]
MYKTRARAQTHFPSVLLTLISIIQALALELMWSKIVESDFLWSWGIQSLLGWGMISACFLGILQLWVMYSTMVMGFVWQPFLRDSILPFIIGIQEFMLISLVGSEFSVMWLYVLGSIFVSANWVTHNSLRRARSNDENAQFFVTVKPAGLKDFAPTIALVLTLVLFGLLIEFTDEREWLPLAAILFANIVLLLGLIAMRRLWSSLMGLTENRSADEDESE